MKYMVKLKENVHINIQIQKQASEMNKKKNEFEMPQHFAHTQINFSIILYQN